MSNPHAKIVHSPSKDEGKENPDSVITENTNRTHDVTSTVLFQVRKQRTQAFGQHVLLIDVILSGQASVFGSLVEERR